MHHHRLFSDRLHRLFATLPVVLICGARQVGKSTLLANTLGKKADTNDYAPPWDILTAKKT